MENNNVQTSKITSKEFHEIYWKCRDFELSHLWQRSIFLSAFLVLCITGYGITITKLIDSISCSENVDFIAYNGLAFLLCILGIIFSCMWVMMGKGSKAWYEVYEEAIKAYEETTNLMDEGAIQYGGFKYYAMERYQKPKMDKKLYTHLGGAFSVSKINIAIGQTTLFLWIVGGIFHAVFFFLNDKLPKPLTMKIFIILIGVILLGIFFWLIYKKKWMNSGFLYEKFIKESSSSNNNTSNNTDQDGIEN